MKFLHWEFDLEAGDVLQVELNKQANVRLLDGNNFHAYRTGRQHRYHGGLAKQSPVRLPAPHAGRWHIVVDLGGYAGSVQANVTVI
ncbi:MAG TPA: DUF1883 domain-containing protein [Pirellulaceae bacterium]|nr:DUF1883 domain-containing protein [Pirellulaceae bacterium]